MTEIKTANGKTYRVLDNYDDIALELEDDHNHIELRVIDGMTTAHPVMFLKASIVEVHNNKPFLLTTKYINRMTGAKCEVVKEEYDKYYIRSRRKTEPIAKWEFYGMVRDGELEPIYPD